MRVALAVLGSGTAITLLFFGLAYLAAAAGNLELSYALYWQAWTLEQLMPCGNAGFSAGPGCEITVWHLVAFYVGLPLGVVIYSLLVYAGYRVCRRRSLKTAQQ